MTDPIEDLSHDHAELNQLVLALATAIRTAQAASSPARVLIDPVGRLRDLLFLHFAREEEGLFPFVADAVSELTAPVRQMEIAHDTICGALARMYHLAASDGAVATIASLFERFQVLYADHASAEALLLQSLDKKLDAAHRAQLAALVDGL